MTLRYIVLLVLVLLVCLAFVWTTLAEEPCCIDAKIPGTCDEWVYELPGDKGWKWCPANGKIIY